RRKSQSHMSDCCIDASVIVKLVLKGESHRRLARRLVRDLLASGVRLIAPAFCPYEVDTVIRRAVHRGLMSHAEAVNMYGALDSTNIHVVDHPQLRQRTREIAEQFNQPTVYDASYAALAELHGCELWTADKRFYDAVRSVLTFVKYLPDYP